MRTRGRVVCLGADFHIRPIRVRKFKYSVRVFIIEFSVRALSILCQASRLPKPIGRLATSRRKIEGPGVQNPNRDPQSAKSEQEMRASLRCLGTVPVIIPSTVAISLRPERAPYPKGTFARIHTETHRAYVHITPQVEEILRKSGVKEGMVLVSAMHITAGVYVNDNESGLIEDIDQWLEHLAPFRKDYKHHNTGEDNGESHLKALLIHHEVIVPITGGKLDLGTWQRIFYAEFDGQRDKRVIVKVMGE